MEEQPRPEGLSFWPELVSIEHEAELVGWLSALRFDAVRMHGVVAKREVRHFGWDYGYDSWKISPTEPIPEALLGLREQVAAQVGLAAEAFEEVLVTRYPPGAGIGWHRDAPMFGPLVAGVSLAGTCVMRFRSGPGRKVKPYSLTLPPRSAYALEGQARTQVQHSIPPVPDLRYSVTFRTVRARRGDG